MRRCPVCEEKLADDNRSPFCSARCRTVDLGRWLSGDYVISRPLEAADLDEDLVRLPISLDLEEPS